MNPNAILQRLQMYGRLGSIEALDEAVVSRVVSSRWGRFVDSTQPIAVGVDSQPQVLRPRRLVKNAANAACSFPPMRRTFRLECRAWGLSHPAKPRHWRDQDNPNGQTWLAQAAGQDAFYAGDGIMIVADGVGSWPDGKRVSLFARMLVDNLARMIGPNLDLIACIWKALGMISTSDRVHASSTVCIAVLDSNTHRLRVANLGDSGVRVVRQGQVVFATAEQQHYPNCPFQLGCADSPDAADTYELCLYDGDAVIVGTDGLYDNLHDQSISNVVAQSVTPSEACKRLGEDAAKCAFSGKGNSPFAQRHGLQGGGKPDDISVVVGFVYKS